MAKIEIRDEYLASEVKGLNLNIGYANLTVREEATDKVTVCTTRDEEKSAKYSCELKNGMLEVEAGNVKVEISLFGKDGSFRKGEIEKDEVCITVPCGMQFESLELDLGAGMSKFSNVSSSYDRAKLAVGAGALAVDAMKVDGHITMGLGAGSIEVQNLTAQTADLDCGVGRMLVSGAVEKDIDISCGVGSIEMHLDAVESEYNYSVECALGSVLINGSKRGGVFSSLSQMMNPGAKGMIKLNCGVGRIELITQKRISVM